MFHGTPPFPSMFDLEDVNGTFFSSKEKEDSVFIIEENTPPPSFI